WIGSTAIGTDTGGKARFATNRMEQLLQRFYQLVMAVDGADDEGSVVLCWHGAHCWRRMDIRPGFRIDVRNDPAIGARYDGPIATLRFPAIGPRRRGVLLSHCLSPGGSGRREMRQLCLGPRK